MVVKKPTKPERAPVREWEDMQINGREPGCVFRLEVADFDVVITKMIMAEHWWLTTRPALVNAQLDTTDLETAKTEALEKVAAVLQKNLMELSRAIKPKKPGAMHG